MMSKADQPVKQDVMVTMDNLAPTNNNAKQPFVTPKLTFMTPKLTKRGDFADLTEGFFGTFTPPAS